MVTLESLLEAYYACRRNKRGKEASLAFEMRYEERLVSLRNRINDGTYRPGTSVCFIVKRPRWREVFAADFEDRVVHHWICLRLEPLFEEDFTDRSFNCRRGKGQLLGVRTLAEDVRECTEGYTRDAWICRMDIRGFFMSIDRAMLADLLDAYLAERYEEEDREDLRRLCRIVVTHAPERDCVFHSPRSDWRRIAPEKSLFTNGEGMGMAIGNLPSQMLANFLLDRLDKFVTRDLGFPFYGRYVDDFYIVDSSKERILEAAPRIREFLMGYGITLHPRKFYIQHYTKGARFTGCVVRPGRVYVERRTVRSFLGAVRRLEAARTVSAARAALPSVNSYLGLLGHHATYAIRRRALGSMDPEVYRRIYVRDHFKVAALRKRYTLRARTLRRIGNERRGRYAGDKDADSRRGARGGALAPLPSHSGGGRRGLPHPAGRTQG